MNPTADRRGQNLLLFALTLLLLMLMVTLTLGIAMRVRDNHEMQNVADAAAYTSAVETARAYNDAAILNRLQVSYWVTQAAVQSEISWTSYARAELSAAFYAAFIDSFSCNFFGLLDIFVAIFDNVIVNNLPDWTDKDEAAGAEAKLIQGMVAGLRDEIDLQTFPQLQQRRQNQTLAKFLTNRSGAVGASVMTNGPELVTTEETMCVGGGIGAGGNGLCRGGDWSRQMVDAAMGTRLHPFLTSRGVAPQVIDAIWNQLRIDTAGAVDVVAQAPTGSGYWSFMSDTPTHGRDPDGTRSWGDDHGQVTVTLHGPNPGLLGLFWLGSSCPATSSFPILTYVKSTEIEDNTDQHVITPDGVAGALNDTPDVHHTMGSCAPWCPSVWVSTFDFDNAGHAENDAWGQPKAYVGLERDYNHVARPWDLMFNFHFERGAAGTEFDNRGRTLMGRFARGLDISHAVSLGTAMTYYHRKGQRNGIDLWQESANLLNPYWRATLVPADVDAAGDPNDMAIALGGPTHQWQLDAYQQLQVQGFKGIH